MALKLNLFLERTPAPAYGHPPIDGAKYRCSDCAELFDSNGVYFVKAIGNRPMILCNDCIDPWFKENATFVGQLEF